MKTFIKRLRGAAMILGISLVMAPTRQITFLTQTDKAGNKNAAG